MSADFDRFDKMDSAALRDAMMNPDSGEEIHKIALEALSKRTPKDRNENLVQVLRVILRAPDKWQPDVPRGIIDVFATDPDPEATTAMLDLLPDVLEVNALQGSPLVQELCEYYYEVLSTRQRDDDLEVWMGYIPKIEAPMLVQMQLDPQAGPLREAIAPVELIGQLDEPGRTSGLMDVIGGAVRGGEINDDVREVFNAFKNGGANREAYQGGVARLADRYEEAKKNGNERYMQGLHKVLAVIDKTPRSAGEKLTGRRPWAP